MKTIISIILIGILFACGKQNTQTEHSLGKYVYIDDNGIIHVDETCYRLRHGKDMHGHDTYAKEVIDTTLLIMKPDARVCAVCMDDEDYEHLMKISERNNDTDIDTVARDESEWCQEMPQNHQKYPRMNNPTSGGLMCVRGVSN